ncbi:hypothetical protein B0O80DRAFT_460678 [Mortierella sp. GBAus27b]|nr:hypothetical protein B0O80DRAFT_460678 [Mortierella sp. GBAus27b]
MVRHHALALIWSTRLRACMVGCVGMLSWPCCLVPLAAPVALAHFSTAREEAGRVSIEPRPHPSLSSIHPSIPLARLHRSFLTLSCRAFLSSTTRPPARPSPPSPPPFFAPCSRSIIHVSRLLSFDR